MKNFRGYLKESYMINESVTSMKGKTFGETIDYLLKEDYELFQKMTKHIYFSSDYIKIGLNDIDDNGKYIEFNNSKPKMHEIHSSIQLPKNSKVTDIKSDDESVEIELNVNYLGKCTITLNSY